MIDLHSHLIPNVDDGSKSVGETVDLIKEAKIAGFSDIILTPHFLLNSYEPDLQELILWKNKLQELIDKERISINLHLGMEVYITEEIIDLIKKNKIITLENSKYLLMELPLNSNVRYLDNVIFRLLQCNIVPVIAHPERYKMVQENPKIVEELIEKGCMIQSNYGSILGIYGQTAKSTIKYLLRNNLVHFLGTDTHKANTIYPKIEKAINKIKKVVGEETVERLTTTNAREIIENN